MIEEHCSIANIDAVSDASQARRAVQAVQAARRAVPPVRHLPPVRAVHPVEALERERVENREVAIRQQGTWGNCKECLKNNAGEMVQAAGGLLLAGGGVAVGMFTEMGINSKASDSSAYFVIGGILGLAGSVAGGALIKCGTNIIEDREIQRDRAEQRYQRGR